MSQGTKEIHLLFRDFIGAFVTKMLKNVHTNSVIPLHMHVGPVYVSLLPVRPSNCLPVCRCGRKKHI